MAKQINLTAHRIEDSIVKDCVSAINVLESERDLKGRIGGGMAVQSYLSKESHRRTIDLDMSFPFQGSFTSFQNFCGPLREHLRNLDYDVLFKKKGYAYEIYLNRDEEKGKNSFLIQHPSTRSKKHFGKILPSLEREISNRRIISLNGVKYPVISPEDLIAIKIHRALILLNEYGIKIPKDISVKNLRNLSRDLRERIVLRTPDLNPEEVASLRLVNDFYDAKSLAEQVGLNGNYFSEVAKDWKDSKVGEKDFYQTLDRLGIFLD